MYCLVAKGGFISGGCVSKYFNNIKYMSFTYLLSKTFYLK